MGKCSLTNRRKSLFLRFHQPVQPATSSKKNKSPPNEGIIMWMNLELGGSESLVIVLGFSCLFSCVCQLLSFWLFTVLFWRFYSCMSHLASALPPFFSFPSTSDCPPRPDLVHLCLLTSPFHVSLGLCAPLFVASLLPFFPLLCVANSALDLACVLRFWTPYWTGCVCISLNVRSVLLFKCIQQRVWPTDWTFTANIYIFDSWSLSSSEKLC